MLRNEQMEIWRSRESETEIKNLIGGLTVKEKISEIEDWSLENIWLKHEKKKKDKWYKTE